MDGTKQTIPRWVRKAGAEDRWPRINELIEQGWGAAAIMRELEIPEEQRRSLQQYVRDCGPGRRLTQFAKFKDALLEHIEEFGSDLIDSLKVIGRLAVSVETQPKTQVRALEAMNAFARTLDRLMAADREEVRDQEKASDSGAVDASEMVRRILDAYNVTPAAKDQG